MKILQIVCAALFGAALSLSAWAVPGEVSTAGVKRQGRYIVNPAGQIIAVHGFNEFSMQLSQQGFGHKLPNGNQFVLGRTKIGGKSFYQHIKEQFGVNAIRIMINEYSWRTNIVIGGLSHRQAMIDLVNEITNNQNMICIVVLGSTEIGSGQTNLQYGNINLAMPNTVNTPGVWTSLTDTFKNNSRVMFGLYNEPTPYLVANAPSWLPQAVSENDPDDYFVADELSAAKCLLNGGNDCAGTRTVNEGGYTYVLPPPAAGSQSMGMQAITTLIRSRGATNVIVVPGAGYSGDHTYAQQYAPNDPLNNLAYSVHRYSSYGSQCLYGVGPTYLDRCKEFLERGQKAVGTGVILGTVYPIFYDEFGSISNASNGVCTDTYMTFLMDYAKSKQQGYFAHEGRATHPTSSEAQVDSCGTYGVLRRHGDEGDAGGVPLISNYGKEFKNSNLNYTWSYGTTTPPDPGPDPGPTPPPDPGPDPVPPGALKNGGFVGSIGPDWSLAFSGAGDGYAEWDVPYRGFLVEAPVARISITGSNAANHDVVRFVQTGLSFTAGQARTIKVRVRTLGATRDIRLSAQLATPPATEAGNAVCSVPSTGTVCTLTFTPGSTVSTGAIAIQLGRSKGIVEISGVSLQ